MGFLNDNIGGSSGGGGERGQQGIAGRGIQSITTVDNNNGTINLTFTYDDGSEPDTFVNSLVSDSLIQLDRLTLEGSNNSVKFSINQADETVIYKCDTVAGINIMKRLLVGTEIRVQFEGDYIELTKNKITFGNISFVNQAYLTTSNDENIISVGGKLSQIIEATDDFDLTNKFYVDKKVLTAKTIGEDAQQTAENALEIANNAVSRVNTNSQNIAGPIVMFNNLTMLSGEDITFENEASTGITSILKTKTNKIIIPDTVLNIVDTSESPIMQVKADNNVDIFNQLNVKNSSGGTTYTDFPFTTLSNRDGTNYGFECGTHFLISTTPLICTGVLDFINQYSAQVNTTCVITGDMSAFSLSIQPNGRFQFSFTAGVSGTFGFAFSTEMAIQIGMSTNPPDPSKIINGGLGIGELYMLFQTTATAGTTYNFQSDALFGNTVINNAISITADAITSDNNILIRGAGLNVESNTSLNVISNILDINTIQTIDIKTGDSIDINVVDNNFLPTGFITLTSGTLNIVNNITDISSNNTIFKKTVSIGTEPISTFGGEIFRVFNPSTTEEVFNVNSTFTYIKTLNDITNPSHKGCLYYSNETTGDLEFFPRADYDCSFITWKSNKPVWRIPYMAELVNNPYINDALGGGTNIPTTITGWTELNISDNNIYFNSAPSPTFFTRVLNGNTTIRYVGFPFALNDYKFRVSYTVSLSGFNNQTVELALYKNGLRIDTTINKLIFSSNSEYEVMSRITIISLLKNDTLSVRVNSNQSEITVSNYNMLIETAC